jgi:hypothetical protein
MGSSRGNRFIAAQFDLVDAAAMNAASVCRKFETSRRRDNLSFNHHSEVAALPPAEADALLG